MTKAVRLSDYAGAAVTAARREASSTANAIGLSGLVSGGGSAPDSLPVRPGDLYQSDAERGQALMERHYALAGDVLELTEDEALWRRSTPSRAFARALHEFGWLRDLLSLESEAAVETARARVDEWIAAFGRWNSFSWEAGVLSDRLTHWLQAGPALFEDEDAKAVTRRFRALMRQARFLQRAIPVARDGAPRLKAAMTLALCGVCLPRQDALMKAGMAALRQEITRQVLPDGGHVSRAPRAAAEALIDLVVLMRAAEERGVALPEEALKAMDRLAPMTRFFQMSDQGLASFHGGGEGDRQAIALALEADRTDAKVFGFAPHSGYHRAHAGGATVLFDVGEAARGSLSAGAHASALAFEMDAAGGRLVVNCGWSDDQPPHWREAVRATAAHSTLTLEETSSARLLPPGWRRRLLGPRLATAPGPIIARRNEEDMGVWLEGTHKGYRDLYGLCHRRRIFLAADGGDLRGEDALFRLVEDGAPEDVEKRYRFAIRFHLHPSVRASLSRDAMSALLVQPNGDGWRFRTDGGPVRLERSVYLAAGAPQQRATQIVVQGEAEPFGAGDNPPNRVRWAFQRLGRIGGAGGEVGAPEPSGGDGE
jgi:uncharacterized heparinase superfamily protein